MQIELSPEAYDHIKHWQKSGNKIILNKIEKLVESILVNPYEGIGKPEALKYNLSGYWSRRIDNEHRLIYTVKEDTIQILSMMGHYE